jgi:hypothetical protein
MSSLTLIDKMPLMSCDLTKKFLLRSPFDKKNSLSGMHSQQHYLTSHSLIFKKKARGTAAIR